MIKWIRRLLKRVISLSVNPMRITVFHRYQEPDEPYFKQRPKPIPFVKKGYVSKEIEGVEVDCDFTLKRLKEVVEVYTPAYYTAIVDGLVVGTLTREDIICMEIDFHQRRIKNCKRLGFGNSILFGKHCLMVLREVY